MFVKMVSPFYNGPSPSQQPNLYIPISLLTIQPIRTGAGAGAAAGAL